MTLTVEQYRGPSREMLVDDPSLVDNVIRAFPLLYPTLQECREGEFSVLCSCLDVPTYYSVAWSDGRLYELYVCACGAWTITRTKAWGCPMCAE